MKYIKKDAGQIPIIFDLEEHKDKKYIDLSQEGYPNWKPWHLKDYVKLDKASDINDESWSYRSLYRKMYGVLLKGSRGRYIPLVLIIKDIEDNNELKAIINKSFIEGTPSYKTYLNNFARAYGIKKKKCFIYEELSKIELIYGILFDLGLQDYSPDIQKEFSSKFLTKQKELILAKPVAQKTTVQEIDKEEDMYDDLFDLSMGKILVDTGSTQQPTLALTEDTVVVILNNDYGGRFPLGSIGVIIEEVERSDYIIYRVESTENPESTWWYREEDLRLATPEEIRNYNTITI